MCTHSLHLIHVNDLEKRERALFNDSSADLSINKVFCNNGGHYVGKNGIEFGCTLKKLSKLAGVESR